MLELGVWLARRLTAKDPPAPKTPPAPLTEAEKKAQAIRHCRRVLWFVVGVYAATIPLVFFEFVSFSFLPEVFYDLVPFAFEVVKIAAEVYAVYVAIRYIRHCRFWAVYPFLVVALAFQIVGRVGPFLVNIKSYHELFYKERESLVQAVCDKEVALKKAYWDDDYYLPFRWKHLAVSDGFVTIQCGAARNTAVFYTFRGIRPVWQGLVYRSDGSWPDDDEARRADEIILLSTKWYYVIR